MNFKHVTVAGSGVLGSQIAFQTAFHGYQVRVYDINDQALEKAKERLAGLQKVYKDFFKDEAKAEAASQRFTFSSDLAEAVKNADLIIEAIPEVVDIKTNFYKQLSPLAPEKTIIVTNSSTMVPSQFAEYTGRPEKFLALHFANEVWKNNTAEIMGHAGTDWEIEQEIIDFAASIGMVPLHIKKEQPGYILNSLLVPFLDAAEMLWINDIADPETIDKTWMIATGAPTGPFAILDVVGIQTAYNIALGKAQADPSPDNKFRKMADILKAEFLDKGKTGQGSGEGFYKYPNPAYADPNFLKS
ncbi:3-hydroxyacyl-CoA dehydrogenase [Paenibacillus dokdonensis]|uniref:3-hydroxyacyl-CoA dehydrogenase n=1 Tax=Paenibacillus dokdonensis TaxID=2567944 RepID=A0ABU6GV95_9BACL|nr:3-hydroxyacyl-CoA dehydrogenase [Paenibacillus dokdonensis]MEC0243675.1 3-hydroxyacyl-CoA dehydrogenase [Paenibacillus dokdonensis]